MTPVTGAPNFDQFGHAVKGCGALAGARWAPNFARFAQMGLEGLEGLEATTAPDAASGHGPFVDPIADEDQLARRERLPLVRHLGAAPTFGEVGVVEFVPHIAHRLVARVHDLHLWKLT